jgi:DNA-binding NarL/FixJ family response regulator
MQALPKLIIVDEHEIIRDGISALVTSAECGEVVACASDGYNAIKLCRTVDPDIILMDLSITRPSGIETFRKIRSIKPDLKIILYSSDANKSEAFSLLSNGAVGFISKQAKGVDFVNAVRCATLGYVCIPGAYVDDFMTLRQNAQKTGNMYGLSPRELEILEACVSGEKSKDVAERMKISVRTVETHRNSIYRKTSCHSIGELAEIAGRLS